MYGLAAIITGLAPKDPSETHALVSRVHVDATVVGGAALVLAMLIAARRSPTAAMRSTSAWSAGLAIGGVVVFRLAWGSPIYGLMEKGLLVLAAWWLVACATPKSRERQAASSTPRSDSDATLGNQVRSRRQPLPETSRHVA
jgi:hypothetical protein